MTRAQVQEALNAVRQLQVAVLVRRQFRGYSGKTRMVSGVAALVLAYIMSLPLFPKTDAAFTVGWSVLCLITMFCHAMAIVWWFFQDEEVAARGWRGLAPVLDVVPIFFLGGFFSLVLLLQYRLDLLYGFWMCMFALANWASRYVMPSGAAYVACYYMFCGVLYLLAPATSFLNPWPMGIVFGLGEIAGGLVLCSGSRATYAEGHNDE